MTDTPAREEISDAEVEAAAQLLLSAEMLERFASDSLLKDIPAFSRKQWLGRARTCLERRRLYATVAARKAMIPT